MGEVLRRLGCDGEAGGPTGTVTIDVPARPGHEADYDLVRRMRASIAVLGPLVARCGRPRWRCPAATRSARAGSTCTSPGLSGSARRSTASTATCSPRRSRLTGAQVWLDFPSVGATENLLMAAVLAKGTTVIDNAAREPEIVDLCELLAKMGAQIDGIGTSTLEIEGVERLAPVRRTPPCPTGSWPAPTRSPRS